METTNRTLTIGDNLPILRSLAANSVTMVYLDPPFNSNRNYTAEPGTKAAGASFTDKWSPDDVHPAWIDEIKQKSPSARAVIETSRQTANIRMEAYLTMIAIRLIEVKRLLNSEGALFLHCDSSASAYLKLLCDAIFGNNRFKNEIVWKRTTTHNDVRSKFGHITDSILFYGYRNIHIEQVAIPYDPEYIRQIYNKKDERGLYARTELKVNGLKDGYSYYYHKHYATWRYPMEKMQQLEAEGRICLPTEENRVPYLKRYLADMKGKLPMNLWDDISLVKGKEKNGYKTQKPLALLKRMINATTSPGDMVLDPFMGSGTTLVAAEQLNRAWFGIDISPQAGEVAAMRLKDECDLIENKDEEFLAIINDENNERDYEALVSNWKDLEFELKTNLDEMNSTQHEMEKILKNNQILELANNIIEELLHESSFDVLVDWIWSEPFYSPLRRTSGLYETQPIIRTTLHIDQSITFEESSEFIRLFGERIYSKIGVLGTYICISILSRYNF